MQDMRAPWGYIVDREGKLVATTGQAQIRHRAELGEAAIRLLDALGIKADVLEEMLEITEPAELLARLKEKTT